MPNAAISTLISQITTVTPDATAVNNYQDNVFYEAARLTFPGVVIQTDAAFVQAVKGQATYTLPTGHRIPLIFAFDERQLGFAKLDEARYYGADWRSTPGDPFAVILDPEDRDKFALVPPPRADGEGVGISTPLVFTDWPSDDIMVISTTVNTDFDGTNYEDTHLAIAFEVIARELGRDSDHMDDEAAKAAKQMANVFWRMSFPEIEPVERK